MVFVVIYLINLF